MNVVESVTSLCTSIPKGKRECGKIHLDYTNPHEWGTMEWDAGQRYRHVTAEMRFRDCYGKPITLDFNIDKFRYIAPRLRKLDNMIAELQKFREAYIRAIRATPFKD